VRAIVFGAVGTTGQRCTSTRRVLVQEQVASELLARLERAYAQIRIGHPLEDGVLMGPLVDEHAVRGFQLALEAIRAQGGVVRAGGHIPAGHVGGCYVQPTLVESKADMPILKDEVFAPILHVVRISDLAHGIALNNDVPQGLSSALFTNEFKSAERFLSVRGSDCGIANVNAGTSGAEIGGAFGGEKETGGGRESGSDSWKAYMRRQTSTLNFGDDLPLAQGIRFLG
jgi:aldehyde dehydrogenase (NAD+)